MTEPHFNHRHLPQPWFDAPNHHYTCQQQQQRGDATSPAEWMTGDGDDLACQRAPNTMKSDECPAPPLEPRCYVACTLYLTLMSTRCGFSTPQTLYKPLPPPLKYPYPWKGYGFASGKGKAYHTIQYTALCPPIASMSPISATDYRPIMIYGWRGTYHPTCAMTVAKLGKPSILITRPVFIGSLIPLQQDAKT
ncbi:uncharacterized protein LACBIDRAFT_323110 [Laccaria bicolor S238N-H82]|uniref:Predicted protein n=1 Tax=Laccaria bicolor (strain S238N-H82 / ATCC MYA-4686) TaxID=486041 RepID=B0CZ57_LACBS|nr:uncharacterized protein LACBIDRAFT_323110 [Laccaria bicolor S238N-H82]EDR12563.1 predicted protein [Laccaria bicolor S238N-H82]|eukprot:XP_001876827.1 predicted protein [Laccaria bicolor S238N-H82]